MRKTRISAMALAAFIAIVLTGCGSTQSGTAVVGSTAAQSTTAPVTVTRTAAPKPKPTPTVTATVTQPPVVVVPVQPPRTVYQQPTTVYAGPGCTEDCGLIVTADQEVSSDSSIAESTIGWWIPQLSSKQDSTGAMSRFWSLHSTYPDVFMVWSGNYSTFVYSNYYVAMVPREYSTAAEANAWCDAQGFSADNCFAKRLSHTDGPDGNSVER